VKQTVQHYRDLITCETNSTTL